MVIGETARGADAKTHGGAADRMVVDQALYRRTVLPNGLVVLTEPMDHVRTASLGVWIGAGSRHEQRRADGHLSLHRARALQGTATRSALEIAQAMDGIGGHLNAFTDKEHTCYYLASSAIISMRRWRPRRHAAAPGVRTEALERERQVILEEIAMYEDAPDDLVHDLLRIVDVARAPARVADRGHP